MNKFTLEIKPTALRLLSITSLLSFVLITLMVEITSGDVAMAQVDKQQKPALQQSPTPRGLIYDRNGKRLVINRYLYQVSYPVAKQKLLKNLTLPKGKKENGAITLTGLELTKVLQIESFMGRDELTVTAVPIREYSDPHQLAHIIGYVGKPTAEDVAAGVEYDQLVGRYKLEELFDDQLRAASAPQGAVGKRMGHCPEVARW